MIIKASHMRARLQEIRDYTNARVLEREAETDSILISLLSGASLFLLGDVGAAKTQQLQIITRLLGLTFFESLMSQSTKPEQIFGPVDVPALAKGVQRQKIERYAPGAQVLFFDEMFKANEVVLDPLLWLVNEHIFVNGDDGTVQCPTVTWFAASNEIPTEKRLRAIYDRLIIRHEVQYIKSHKMMHRLLDLVNKRRKIEEPQPLTAKELRYLMYFMNKVEFTHELWDMAIKIRDQVQQSVGVRISDRRMTWIVPVVRAHAFLHGRKVAAPMDLEILAHMFWDTADQIRKVRSIVYANCSVERGDLLSYTETSDSIYEKAVKTGAFEEGLTKLKELAQTTKQLIDTSTGKQVHTGVVAHIRSIRNVLETRETIIVFPMHDADGNPWLKLSEACANVWTQDQLRSVGFKFRRSLGYWWRPMNKNAKAYEQFTQLVAKKLKSRVEKKGLM